jgi:S-adenosylmethionine decarboxylase
MQPAMRRVQANHPDRKNLVLVPAPSVDDMRLWTLDARVRDSRVLTDLRLLRSILCDAAELGGATVVGEEFCAFPNGAVTGVLVLAQSHLSIHTWPECALVNVDLLSCGPIAGEEVLRTIAERLGAERVNTMCMLRSQW